MSFVPGDSCLRCCTAQSSSAWGKSLLTLTDHHPRPTLRATGSLQGHGRETLLPARFLRASATIALEHAGLAYEAVRSSGGSSLIQATFASILSRARAGTRDCFAWHDHGSTRCAAIRSGLRLRQCPEWIGEGLCRHCCSGTYQRSNPRGLRGWHKVADCAAVARSPVPPARPAQKFASLG
jgi:hypothetical protein